MPTRFWSASNHETTEIKKPPLGGLQFGVVSGTYGFFFFCASL